MGDTVNDVSLAYIYVYLYSVRFGISFAFPGGHLTFEHGPEVQEAIRASFMELLSNLIPVIENQLTDLKRKFL